MLIESPHSLHYPIRVTALLKRTDESVERFAPLFSYTYKHTVTEGNKYGDKEQVERTFPAEFQSETDGKVSEWKIKREDIIHGPGYAPTSMVLDVPANHLSRVPLVEIEEPCTHE